jgi:hypothetical protein
LQAAASATARATVVGFTLDFAADPWWKVADSVFDQRSFAGIEAHFHAEDAALSSLQRTMADGIARTNKFYLDEECPELIVKYGR